MTAPKAQVEVVSKIATAVHDPLMVDSTNTAVPAPAVETNTEPVSRTDALVIGGLKNNVYHLPYHVLAETSVVYYYYAVKRIQITTDGVTTTSYVYHKVLQATLGDGVDGVAGTAIPETHEFGDVWSAVDAESFLTYELVGSTETPAFALLWGLGWADYLEVQGDGAQSAGWNGYLHTY